ncbi:MAG: haloacid dehalogenase-like hydrolase [Candidatus Saccharibacteria bacterium]|nr:haloacid dehalogenase-like hydrolase [Candidatus Saccharibacteria bacterium]
MITFAKVQGAIYDLDDTLLDNGPADQPALWLHSRSRLAAVHQAAKIHNIPELLTLTGQENGLAFMTATEHSLNGAIWNIFYLKGLTPTNEVQLDGTLVDLAQEIAERKNELHEVILREYGVEFPGASDFIKRLGSNGLFGRQALATSAIQRDIDIFLDKYSLHEQLPPEHIISNEKVTKPKPDPECFDLAFRSLGLPDSARRSVLAFEDNPRGMQSAKEAGLFLCAITTRMSADDPLLLALKPDLVAGSYAEFARLLGVPN